MRKILTSAEMQAADRATFERIGIPSRAVMETAGREAARFAAHRYADRLWRGVLVLCGSGNNGGDGLVAARMLRDLGVDVAVAVARPVAQLKGDAHANAESWAASGGRLTELDEGSWNRAINEIDYRGIVIDALFGTGVTGPLRGFVAQLIQGINEYAGSSDVPVCSIDLPSGLQADDGAVPGPAIWAEATVALQCLKPAHVLYPGTDYCGEIFVADIGVANSLPEISGVQRHFLTEDYVARLLREAPPSPEEHKGTRGHLLVVGGSLGRYGAPRMSAEAAIRCGAGLVTLALPQTAAAAMAPNLRELMCSALPENDEGEFSEDAESALDALAEGKRALVVGPGMGLGVGAERVVAWALRWSKSHELPLVLDADALTVLARKTELHSLLHPQVVLTPHPGEMSRLLETDTASLQADRLGSAARLATSRRATVVLKGARTVIAGPDGSLAINPAATPALASAGSGDTLAGIIGALAMRFDVPAIAAQIGVFVHGCAGELCEARKGGGWGTIAGELAIQAPVVLNTLLRLGPARPAPIVRLLPGAMHRLWEELSE